MKYLLAILALSLPLCALAEKSSFTPEFYKDFEECSETVEKHNARKSKFTFPLLRLVVLNERDPSDRDRCLVVKLDPRASDEEEAIKRFVADFEGDRSIWTVRQEGESPYFWLVVAKD